MFEKSFKGINILENSMNAAWLRNEVISNNMANVNTPNYKKSVVKFESILRESLSNLSIAGKLTHEKHIPIGMRNVEEVQPVIVKDFNSKYRKDGNNVNIDVEMANLAKNAIKYNALAQRISGRFHTLKLAVRDGR